MLDLLGKIAKPPDALKHVYDWSKIYGLIGLLIGWVASYFYGQERGVAIGASGAGLFALGYFVIVITKTITDTAKYAEDALKAGAPGQGSDVLVKRLVLSRNLAVYVISILILITFASLAFAFGAPLYHWVSTAKPTTIAFTNLRYYTPSGEKVLFDEEAPFLNAIVTTLKNEGQDSGKKFQIILGDTAQLRHPTPGFTCELMIGGGKFETSLYAFRMKSAAEVSSFEPMKMDNSDEDIVLIEIPPSEVGDKIFVVARLALVEGKEFPEDLNKVGKLRIVERKQKEKK